jgi:flagellar biosynthesis/type III secretory pathway M-ring protein FliF/YscJ
MSDSKQQIIMILVLAIVTFVLVAVVLWAGGTNIFKEVAKNLNVVLEVK